MTESIDDQISKLRIQIALLEEKKKNELQDYLTPAKRVAVYLHKHMCHLNHIDMCGWDYEEWSDVTRRGYLKKAQKLIDSGMGEQAIYKVVDILYSHDF